MFNINITTVLKKSFDSYYAFNHTTLLATVILTLIYKNTFLPQRKPKNFCMVRRLQVDNKISATTRYFPRY